MAKGERGPRQIPTETREQILKRLREREREIREKRAAAGRKAQRRGKRGPNFVMHVPMQDPKTKI